MRHVLLIGCAALALASCRKAGEAAPVTQGEALKAAQATEADYASGDTGRMMGHYAKGALVFDAGNSLPSDDPATIRGWTAQFASMKPGDVAVSDRKIQIVGPDAFVNSGIGHFTVQAGQARPAVSVRFTQVYQRQADGSFKIVAEHMSSPPSPATAPA